jgi:hypothetical protein
VTTALAEARALAAEAGDRVAAALAEVGLGALAATAEEARARYAAAAALAGDAPEVAGPLQLNRARLAEREGDAAAALDAYRQALGPLALGDDRAGLLAALAAAARLAGADPGSRAEAAALHRRAAAVAAGLGRAEAERAEREAAARLDSSPPAP